ncbi:3-isopropylmalate dehydratase small subunit [Thermogymnomonas acidicola]|uniref:3-isopropylmalate dehydratase small subunit n=1 Tax=Thermogymnomonas acidicola TaxID=399579 RepID=A0AA37F9I3_9ARCH|nr:3-isopropylmalate dehydratase small subunit [Thermogymnomonas acidicola]GGM73305.1 3-isopropylmalate dehydratase small subunit [Thermogymnomonas acidicola]
MIMEGRVWKLGDNIDTDQIIPARYLVTSDRKKLAEHILEYTVPEMRGAVRPGDIIVAGRNFGSGSSREHAVLAIQGAGISCVVAKSFARIFYRNSINLGLPVIEADVDVEQGDTIRVDTDQGTIDTPRGRYTFSPYPEFIAGIIRAGGLINYVKGGGLRSR